MPAFPAEFLFFSHSHWSCDFAIVVALRHAMVNLLLTNSIKVNIPVSGMSRHMTTGDYHEEECSPDPRALELALRLRLGLRRLERLVEFPAVFGRLFTEYKTICGSARIVFCRVT
jgi:hypothetical protein